jgi:LPXTG-site transpeptidase (sortase) family protein
MLRRALVVSLCVLAATMTYEIIGAPTPAGGDVAGRSNAQPATEPGVATGPDASVTFQSGHKVDLTPARLLIPSINLDATVEARGLDANRDLATARSFNDVAWYNLGPAPGQPGDALINGHVNWWTGDAVFTHLARVRVGDKIHVIRADGVSVWFTVTAKMTVTANARLASLFAPSQVSTLTLITCAGLWNPLTQSDTQRLLVRAVLA